MSDVHSNAIRSYNMSRIKGKDTKPEEIVRKYLFSKGFRSRKHVSTLPGKPDIILPKYKTCIFVNGCFWHKHEGCKYFSWPKNNAEFWKDKLEKNVARDKLEQAKLEKMGWHIIIVWECQLRKKNREQTLRELEEKIKNTQCQVD